MTGLPFLTNTRVTAYFNNDWSCIEEIEQLICFESTKATFEDHFQFEVRHVGIDVGFLENKLRPRVKYHSASSFEIFDSVKRSVDGASPPRLARATGSSEMTPFSTFIARLAPSRAVSIWAVGWKTTIEAFTVGGVVQIRTVIAIWLTSTSTGERWERRGSGVLDRDWWKPHPYDLC